MPPKPNSAIACAWSATLGSVRRQRCPDVDAHTGAYSACRGARVAPSAGSQQTRSYLSERDDFRRLTRPEFARNGTWSRRFKAVARGSEPWAWRYGTVRQGRSDS